MKAFALSQMGRCYQQLCEYQKAIVCFKKQLQLAWFRQDTEIEMSAYDSLAI